MCRSSASSQTPRHPPLPRHRPRQRPPRPMRRVTHRARNTALFLAATVAALALRPRSRGEVLHPAAGAVSVQVAKNGALRVEDKPSSMPSPGPFAGGTARSRCTTWAIPSATSRSRKAGTVYRPGGCTELELDTHAAGTYRAAYFGGRVRIVWHYNAVDEVRTFQIRYISFRAPRRRLRRRRRAPPTKRGVVTTAVTAAIACRSCILVGELDLISPAASTLPNARPVRRDSHFLPPITHTFPWPVIPRHRISLPRSSNRESGSMLPVHRHAVVDSASTPQQLNVLNSESTALWGPPTMGSASPQSC